MCYDKCLIFIRQYFNKKNSQIMRYRGNYCSGQRNKLEKNLIDDIEK